METQATDTEWDLMRDGLTFSSCKHYQQVCLKNNLNKSLEYNLGNNWSPHVAMFGDMGNDNAVSLPWIQREVGDGDYDAVIHVGDMAYDMAELEGKRGDVFMEQIEPIASMVPYMTCPGFLWQIFKEKENSFVAISGNHEWHYNFSNYKARFNMPYDEDKNMFFSFDIGLVHFVSVSTEFYYFLNYGLIQVKNQYEWLEADLAKVDRYEISMKGITHANM